VTLNGGTGAIGDNNAAATNVTAGTLDAAAATGIDVDTDVAFLTASNTVSGGINVADTNGFAVNTVSAAGQTVTLNGGTGAITDNNVAAVNVVADTLSAVAATGIDLDTTVAFLNGSTSGIGNVSFDETDGVEVTSFTTANGAFTLNTSGNTILTSVASTTSSDANDITVTAASGNLSVGTVNAGAGGGDVSLTATTGSLLNNASAVTGDVVTLTAQSAVGASGNRITTTAGTLNAQTTGAGAIWLNETDGVVLGSITAADGLIDIVTGGNTTIASIVSSTDSDANDVTVLATAGDILVNLVDTDVADDGASGDVTITAAAGAINDAPPDPNLDLDVRGDVLTLTGATGVGATQALELDGNTLDIDGGTGGIGINDVNGGDVVLALASAGNISYGTNGNIYVDQVLAGGTVTLISFGGSINDNADDLTTDIVGTTVTLTAFHEIGGNALNVLVPVTDALEGLEIESNSLDLTAGVNASTLATFAGTAGIVVRDIGGTTLGDLDTVNGDITLVSDSTVAVGDVFAGTTTLSDVVLDAASLTDAGAGDIVADLLTVDAAGAITLSTAVNSLDAATSAAGAITITEANDIALVNVSAFDGPVSVSTIGSIAVTAVSAAGQAVTLSAGNAITDANAGAVNVTGSLLDATAVNGISLDTAVDFVTASNSTTGNIDIADTNGFAVNTISALAQTVTLNGGTGAITDNNAGSTNITATLLDATAATGIDLDTDIGELTASNTTSGGINIADTNGFVVNTVSAAGQTVTLDGGTGSIGDNNGAATNVTAALFDVTATTGINLDTAVTLLTASNGTSGGIDIADTDGFGANTILASGQLVTLNGGTGAITDNNGASNNVTATLLTATATTGIDLDTTIGALTATNTTSGGINVADVDGFLVNSVTAAGQTVTLNGGTGALSDGNGVATNVTASLLDATATTGIDLDTDVAFLTASNATVGGINVGDIDGFAVNTVAAAGQLVTLNGGTGAVTDNNGAATNVTALALSVTGTTGIDLDTSVDVLGAVNTTSGGINISDVNGFGLSVALAPLQTVTLNGGTGAITDDNGAATNVTAGTLDITAATGIDVDTAIDVLTASNTTSGGINIADTNGFALNTVSAAGQTVTLSGGTGAITDNNAAATNVTASLLIAIATTGIDVDTAITELTALNTTSGGINVTDTDGFAVNSVAAAGQTVTFNAGTGGITDNNGATTNVTAALLDATATTGISLDTAINELTALNTTSGGIDIADTDGFLVNTVSAAGQTVTLNAGTGGLGDNNGVATNVTADQFTATAPAGIDLDTAVNTLTFTSGGAVDLSELDAVALAGASTANTLLLTATSITDGTDGDLNVTSNAVFSAPTITLGNDSGNDTNFGSLTFTSTGAVSIAEDSPTQLTGTSSADSLSLTSNGAITQAAASSLNVTTLTTLNALNNNNITLDQNNDFGTVSITGANLVVLNDTDGDASAANDGLDLGNVSVGSLTATTVGALTDSGNLVAGVAVFSGSSITLGDAGENTNFGTLNFDSDGAVDIELDLGVTLAGNNRAGGALTLVAANGAISDGSGATLDVTGLTTLSAAGNDIQLDNVGHTLSTVAVLDAVNVVLRASDGDGIVLGGMAINGNLGVTADQGDITGSGALVIGGASTFTANGAGSSIIVDDAGNDFTGSVTFGGTGLTTVSVLDTSSLDIAGANLAGDLTVVAAGITTSGAIVVDGTATFDAGAGNNLLLTNAGNDFEELEVLNAADVTVVDLDDIELGDVTISGNLDVTADSVTSSGDLDISGTTTIVTDVGDVVLTGANNDFVGAVDISSAGDVTINDINNVSVLFIDGNNVTITALSGSVTESLADGGTPEIRGTDDIVAGGTLTITAASIGSAADPLELDAGGPIALTAGNIYADFLGDLAFSTLTVSGVTGAVELTGRVITVDADFDPGLAPTDVVLVARGIIVGGGGTVTADTLRLDALNDPAFGGDNNDSSSVIGSLAAPILLDMTSGTNYQVPTLNGGTLNGFGFISASNFTGTDFTTIFSASNNRVFLIANFTDLIASVQGSFITAQIFTIDSSQFRADLNIYGIDGAGLLLPHDQCEDEESADCAKQ
jgi:hypothetical protein